MKFKITTTRYCDFEIFKTLYKSLFSEFNIEGQGYDYFIEVPTLEDLLKIEELSGEPLILLSPYEDDGIYTIEIYDGYRE